jgi:hypothetical protein
MTGLSRQSIDAAKAVLAKCAANDPWFPLPSESIVLAWAEHIARWNLSADELLEAVTVAYTGRTSGFKPLPADIIIAARQIRRDRAERESEAERRAREDRIDQRLAQGFAELAAAKAIPEHPARSEEHTAWATCPVCNRNMLVTRTAITSGICAPCEQVSSAETPQRRQDRA